MDVGLNIFFSFVFKCMILHFIPNWWVIFNKRLPCFSVFSLLLSYPFTDLVIENSNITKTIIKWKQNKKWHHDKDDQWCVCILLICSSNKFLVRQWTSHSRVLQCTGAGFKFNIPFTSIHDKTNKDIKKKPIFLQA